MTLQEIINFTNDLISHSFSNETMTRWVNEVEDMIKRNITQEEVEIKLEYPRDKDVVLLAPSPYDKMYIEYLKAMIRYETREYEEYNNDIEMFNNSFSEYAKYYVRNNRQKTYNFINYE